LKILCTGGAGFVGSLLVPALLNRGHDVTVVDWFLYGDTLPPHERLTCIRADIRHARVVDAEVVIHLACVSNDPSFDLDPELGKSVNYDATVNLVRLAQQASVQRFIYASSSSVYGCKPDGVDVTEDMALEPMTPYAQYKADAEKVVLAAASMNPTVIRPATLCGYSPRQRLDLVVNILTMQAVCKGTITVHGGSQSRANLHVQDMVRAYLSVLDVPMENIGKVAGQVFNVGADNATVLDLAKRVQQICGGKLQVQTDTNDPRSYTVSSRKISRALKFKPQHTIEDAITELRAALLDGRVPNAETDPRYVNIQQMQLCHIS
jgi:nucleoside-diphosphate-sugar epimerase